ncbi:MAG: hypothetical protein ABIE94_05270, partial [archaeon]
MKTRKKAIFSILISITLVLILAYGVSSESFESAPEASSFSEVGQGGSSGYTGEMAFSTPIMSVPGRGSLSFPISLSYSSGISLDQEASFVGLGFNLGAGAITRNTINLPDDYSNGWLNSDSEYEDQDYYSVSFPGGGGQIIADNNKNWYFGNWRAATIASENPVGGIEYWVITTEDGTKYVFGKDPSAKVERKITFDRVKQFECKYNEDYNHNGVPSWKPDDNNENDLTTPFTYAWYLTAILSADYVDGGGDALIPNDGGADAGSWIKFGYEKDETYFTYASPHVPDTMEPTEPNYADGDPWSDDVHKYTMQSFNTVYVGAVGYDYTYVYYNRKESQYNHAYLNSIETPIARADFDLIYDREDSLPENFVPGNPGRPARLNKIELFSLLDNTETKVAWTQFKYSYDLAKGAEGIPTTGKLTLENVTQYGADENPLPPTIFDYYGRDMPYKRFGKDWYGYYNGLGNQQETFACSDLFPDDKCYWEFNDQPITLAGNDGRALGYACTQTKSPLQFVFKISNTIVGDGGTEDAHDICIDERVKAWSIKDVKYPTGGSITYDYECNKFNWDITHGHYPEASLYEQWYGGSRLKSKTLRDGLGQEFTIYQEYSEGLVPLKLSFLSLQPDFSKTGIGRSSYYVSYDDVTTTIGNGEYGKTVTHYRTLKHVEDKIKTYPDTHRCSDKINESNGQMRGQPYKVQVYDSTGELVSESLTNYNFVTKHLFVDDSCPSNEEDEGYCNCYYAKTSIWARPTQSSSMVDGVTSQSQIQYYTDTGFPKKSIANSDATNNADKIVTYSTYAYQYPQYAAMAAKNMLSQPYMQFVGDGNMQILQEVAPSLDQLQGVSALSRTVWDVFDSTRWYPVAQQVWKDAGNGIPAENEMMTTAKNMDYNAYGALIYAEDAMTPGNPTKIFYGDDTLPPEGVGPCAQGGTQYKSALPTCVENAKGHRATTEYDERGNVLRVTDLNNVVSTEYVYDEFGRLVRTYLPHTVSGVPEGHESIYNYYYYGAELGLSGTCKTDG